jgi:signal transduction histidine kinase
MSDTAEATSAAVVDDRDTRGTAPLETTEPAEKDFDPRKPGFFATLRDGGPAGIMVRRMLPAVIIVPAMVAATEYIAESRGLFQSADGLGFSIGMVSAMLVLVLWRTSSHLHRLTHAQHKELQELKRKYSEVDSANRVKGAFLASMSHEIRTPLTAICGFADLLLGRKRTPEEHDEFIRTIKRNGDHLLTITNDILDLSKIEAGKMRVECLSTSPTDLIAEVCSMLRAPAIEKGLTLEVTYDGPIPTQIRTDPTRLRQTLINLVGNAIKFTDAGTVTIVAGLSTPATDKNPMFKIAVSDTGIGLTQEQMDNLFIPFLQADIETTRKFGGTGLGLSISRHLANLLGGDISVSSVKGKGATFTLTVGTGSLDGVPVHDRPLEAGVQPVVKLPEKFQLKGRILLAEDGASNQKLITCYLREAGCSVDIAPNGAEAVEKALVSWRGGLPYDVVLMDMLMPVMDGYQATLKLRQNGYTRPILALTANALAGDRSKCLNVDAMTS